MTWQNGRKLATFTNEDEGIEATFTYDPSGMRTKKQIANLSTTEYVYEDDLLLKMKYGTYLFTFSYDANGSPIGFKLSRTNSTTADTYYYYGLNRQGDIVALYNASGTRIAAYSYDAYGKPLNTQMLLAGHNTAISINPLRYRGYVYDKETGLYYLQSRYYDPETCRFINPDVYYNTGVGLTGCNMFVYCNNNPIFYVDDFGAKPAPGVTVGDETPDEKAVTYARMNNRQVPASNTGSAKNYSEMLDEYNQNCYTYAIQEHYVFNPGDFSGLYPTGYNDVNSVGISVVVDMKCCGYSIREISGPNSKVYDNEYKIALRTGTTKFQGVYDYHFMIQTKTGQWAEKHGRFGPSELHEPGLTPESIPWILGQGPYYDSPILYYAISK